MSDTVEVRVPAGSDRPADVPPARDRAPKPPLWRRFCVAILLILGFLLTPVAVLVTYAKTQVLDTDRYVATVRPLASNPEIQNAVANRVATELLAQVDVKQYVTDALPPQAQALSGPISGAVTSFVREASLRAVQSDLFSRVWVQANRLAHAGMVRVLTGENSAVTVEKSGAVNVDLKGIAGNVKQQLVDSGLTIAEKIPLDKVNGTITLFQSEDLYKARRAASLLDTVGYALPFIVLGCFGGAVLLSTRRRRGFIKAAFAFAAGAIVLALLVNAARQLYLDALPKDVSQGAAAAFFDTMLRSLHTSVRNILLVSVVIAVVAFVSGPARPAVAFRSWWSRAVSWAGADADHAGWGVLSSNKWVLKNKRVLKIVLGVIIFLVAFRWPHPTSAVLIWLVIVGLIGLVLIDFFGRVPAAATRE
jgi:hypothetical protein